MDKLLYNLRNRGTTVVILLLMSAALLALTVHKTIDEHTTGQSCEICVGMDRLSDAITPAIFAAIFVSTLSFLAVCILHNHPGSRQPSSIRCRAPPFSLLQ
jgi:hypothetical protein